MSEEIKDPIPKQFLKDEKYKIGRPKGSKKSEKDRLLYQLKKIWAYGKKHKAAEVIGAASLYAEIQGWKLKKPEVGENGEILKIEFAKDLPVKLKEDIPVIHIDPKPIKDGELLTHAEGSMGMPLETTTTTTLKDGVEIFFTEVESTNEA